MIVRIWYGWAEKDKADGYEQLLNTVVFPSIEARNINGFRGIQLIKKEVGNEIEFATIMWFDSIEAIKNYAGENYEVANVSEKAKELLSRYDKIVKHYNLAASSSITL